MSNPWMDADDLTRFRARRAPKDTKCTAHARTCLWTMTHMNVTQPACEECITTELQFMEEGSQIVVRPMPRCARCGGVLLMKLRPVTRGRPTVWCSERCRREASRELEERGSL